MKKLYSLFLFTVWLATSTNGGTVGGKDAAAVGQVECGSLIYANNQTAVCFGDGFLTDVAKATSIKIGKKFSPVRLDSPTLFQYPFCVFSGEGDFTLNAAERENLRKYLTTGGFIIASPACSNPAWDNALRKAIVACFPDQKLTKIAMSHELFSVVYKIPKLTCKSDGNAFLEGLFLDGRLVLLHSKEGLNDVSSAKGCCCCGGDQIRECVQVNVNALVYALLY